jgi:hypothetical protein
MIDGRLREVGNGLIRGGSDYRYWATVHEWVRAVDRLPGTVRGFRILGVNGVSESGGESSD